MSGIDKPLVTFALFAYNQERYVREAVEGALAQDYENLEIILSDDCSTDRTFEIMSKAVADYDGLHKVRINRNEKNFGLTAHFNRILREARGDIIVVAAGDDISLPNRSSLVAQILTDNPSVMAVSFDDHVIDQDGQITRFNNCRDPGFNNVISGKDFFQEHCKGLSGASRGFRKELYLEFGDLNEACPTEDTPYLVRTFLIGQAYSCPLPGIYYRRHGSNLSGGASLHSMNFQAIFDQYKKDIELARNANLTTDSTADEAHLWASRNLRRRIVRSKIFNRDLSLIEYYKYVLLSQDYNLREKIRFLIRLFFTR